MGRWKPFKQYIKEQRHYFANKGLSSQGYGFPSSHVWMWELDYKKKLSGEELMLLKSVVVEDSWESLDCKEIYPVHPKGDQSRVFTGRTDVEAETPVLWPPDGKSWLIRKDPDAGKNWRQKEKGKTEDEMVGCHHQLNGHEFEQALEVDDGQGGLACCSPWGRKESDTTEQLNWTEEVLPKSHPENLVSHKVVHRKIMCCLRWHEFLVCLTIPGFDYKSMKCHFLWSVLCKICYYESASLI